MVSLNADNPEQGFNQVQCAVHKVYEEIVGGRYEEVLADGAIETTLHLTVQEITKIEDGGQAARGANNVPILSRGRLGDTEDEDDERDDEGDSFHKLKPLRGSPTSKLLAD
jgi:hypothetical protein